MEDKDMIAAGQNTAPIPEQNEPAGEPYTVNNIPVTETQPQYQQSAPQPEYQQAPQYQQTAPQPQYQQPYQQPYQTYPAKPADPGKNNATAAMILGIVSVLFSPTVLIGLGCGIAAIVLAMKSKKTTLAAGLQPETEQKVGFITGIIGTVIGGIGVLGGLLAVLFTIILPILFGFLSLAFH